MTRSRAVLVAVAVAALVAVATARVGEGGTYNGDDSFYSPHEAPHRELMEAVEAQEAPGDTADGMPDGFEKGKEREIKAEKITDPKVIIQAQTFIKEQNTMIGQFSSAQLGLKKILYALTEKDIVLLDEEVQNGFLTEMVESQDKGTTYAMVILTEMRCADRIFATLEFPVWEMRNVTTWQSNDLEFRKTLHFHVPERQVIKLADPSLNADRQAAMAEVNKNIRHMKQHPAEITTQVKLGKIIMASRQSLQMNFRNLFQEYEEVSDTPTDISVTYVLFTTVPTGSVHQEPNEREWLAAVYRDSTGHVDVIALKESKKSQTTQCSDYAATWAQGCSGPQGRKKSASRTHQGATGAGLFQVLFSSLVQIVSFLGVIGALVFCVTKHGTPSMKQCFQSSPGLELLHKRGRPSAGNPGYQSAQGGADEFGDDAL